MTTPDTTQQTPITYADAGVDVESGRLDVEARTVHRDALVEFSGAMRSVAVSFYKIANDIRLMGSGPLAGFGEIHLPDLQPGSSIMPGKVNPVLCETATQVSAQVIGNDAAVAFGGTQGQFELNVFIPMMARNVLESSRLLANTARQFATKLVDGIEPDEERMRTLAESSPSIVTPLNSAIGYENAAKIAKHAVKEGITIRQATIDLGFVDGEKLTEMEFDSFFLLLAVAGNETTRNAISHGMKAFVDYPEQWEIYKEQRPRTAPDEIVRWATPAAGGHFPSLEVPGFFIDDLRAGLAAVLTAAR